MQTSFPDRNFQLWEYKVSHGSLLIRSPKSPGISKNVDLICVGVEYLASPRHIRGFDLVNGTAEEIQELSQLLGKDVAASSVRVILSEGRSDLTPLSGPVRHLKISRKYSVGIAVRPHVRWFAAAGFVRQGRA